MLARIQKQIHAGFTIVELLIVIVVIAILAVIVVVAYNGILSQARASAAQSSVEQVIKKEKLFAVEHGGQYSTDLSAVGFSDSGDTTYQYSVNNAVSPATFCVTVTVATVSYFASEAQTSPKKGGCPGHGQDGVASVTNLATNPSFEADAGGVDVWQNLVLNPSPSGTSNWSFGGQSRNLTNQNGYVQATRVDGTGSTVIRARTTGVVSSTTYTLMGVAFSTTDYTAEIRLRIDDNLTNSALGGTLNLVANVPQPFRFVVTSSAAAYTSLQSITLGGGTSAADQVIGLKNVAVIPGTYTGDYFDGNASPDSDMRALWTGTANASTSVLKGTLAADATAVQTGTNRAVMSTQWKTTGTSSIRIIPTINSTNSWVAPGGDSGGMRLGMQPGKTYTAFATLHLNQPQTGPLSSSARKIVVMREGYSAIVTSSQAPNQAGDHELRATFTVPADATQAFIRLYNGASVGDGDVWYDSFMLVEGDYTGTYHDGSSPNWIWNGSPNTSTSMGPGN